MAGRSFAAEQFEAAFDDEGRREAQRLTVGGQAGMNYRSVGDCKWFNPARSRGRSMSCSRARRARSRGARVLARGTVRSSSRARRGRSTGRSSTPGLILPLCLARARLRRRDGRARARRRQTAGPLGSARRERSKRQNGNPAPGLSPPYSKCNTNKANGNGNEKMLDWLV